MDTSNERYHFTPVRKAIIKKTQMTSMGEVVEKRECLYILLAKLFNNK